jgi:hypothetical protein
MVAKSKPSPRDRSAIARALVEQSEENLALLDVELQRQRDLIGRKVGSAYTKGTLLVGAAGVLGGVSVTNAVGNTFAWLGIVGVIVYVVAAAFGLLAMRPMGGHEVEPDDAIVGSTTFSTLKLKRSLILSHSDALAGYNATIKVRNRLLIAGFVVLAAAWLIATTAAALGYLIPTPVPALHVTIVK